MITGINHIAIVVPDIEAAARVLRDKYGLEVGPRMENAEQGVRLAYIDLGNAKIELLEPSRPDSPVSKFLQRNPKGGIHHFCLGVDDVADSAQGLAERGVRVLGNGKPQHNTAGERIAFIHPADFLGALVEIEEHKS